MGTKSSKMPEPMNQLKSFEELTSIIQEFNLRQRNSKMESSLGFMIQFEPEISKKNTKGLFKSIFFEKRLRKLRIKTLLHLGNMTYCFYLSTGEMFNFAELLNRFSEDVSTPETDENQTRRDSEDETNQCPLCLDKRISMLLPCLHGYCDSCARQWIQENKQKNCPMCRIQVESAQNKFDRSVTHLEDDIDSINHLVKQSIFEIILNKNANIPI